MNIKSWEIWHTYSTSISSENLDFLKIIQNLVDSQAFEFVYSNDGYCVWRSGDDYEVAQTHFVPQANNEGFNVSLCSQNGKESKLTGFAYECFLQSANFAVSNEKLLSEDRNIPAKYIRIYLGQCCASHSSGKDVIFYPVIVVYETGIISVELRFLSSDKDTKVDDFISGGVNLSSFTFNHFRINYGMSEAIDDWANKYHNNGLIRRVKELVETSIFTSPPPKQRHHISANGFSFMLGKVESLDMQSLHNLALSLAGTIKYLSVKRGSVLGYLLLGLPSEIYKKRYCALAHTFFCTILRSRKTQLVKMHWHTHVYLSRYSIGFQARALEIVHFRLCPKI